MLLGSCASAKDQNFLAGASSSEMRSGHIFCIQVFTCWKLMSASLSCLVVETSNSSGAFGSNRADVFLTEETSRNYPGSSRLGPSLEQPHDEWALKDENPSLLGRPTSVENVIPVYSGRTRTTFLASVITAAISGSIPVAGAI